MSTLLLQRRREIYNRVCDMDQHECKDQAPSEPEPLYSFHCGEGNYLNFTPIPIPIPIRNQTRKDWSNYNWYMRMWSNDGRVCKILKDARNIIHALMNSGYEKMPPIYNVDKQSLKNKQNELTYQDPIFGERPAPLSSANPYRPATHLLAGYKYIEDEGTKECRIQFCPMYEVSDRGSISAPGGKSRS